MVLSTPPLREEKKPMVDQPDPIETQLENKTKRNKGTREHRLKHRTHAHKLHDKLNKENQDPYLTKAMHNDSTPSLQ